MWKEFVEEHWRTKTEPLLKKRGDESIKLPFRKGWQTRIIYPIFQKTEEWQSNRMQNIQILNYHEMAGYDFKHKL